MILGHSVSTNPNPRWSSSVHLLSWHGKTQYHFTHIPSIKMLLFTMLVNKFGKISLYCSPLALLKNGVSCEHSDRNFLCLNRLFIKMEWVLVNPNTSSHGAKSFRARLVAVGKDYSDKTVMMADVFSSVEDKRHTGSTLNSADLMAPWERQPRSQIISETQQFSRFNLMHGMSRK